MPERSRTHYSFLNVLTGFGGYITITLLGFVHRYVFIKTLPPDYLGLQGLFGNVFAMLSIADLGIGSAIIYALYKPIAVHDEKQIAALVHFYGKCYRYIGMSILGMGLCMMPFLRFIIRTPPNIKENLYLLYVLSLLGTVVSYLWGYRATVLTAAQKKYIVELISLFQGIITNAINIVVLLTTHNYLYHAIIAIIGGCIGVYFYNYFAFKEFSFLRIDSLEPIAPETKKTLKKNIRALVIEKITGVFVHGIDNITITYFAGLVSTGVTSNYNMFSSLAGTLPKIVFTNLYASVGNFNALESIERQKKLFYILNLGSFWLFGWVAIGIFVCSSDLVQLCFGESFVLPITIPLAIAFNFFLVTILDTPRAFLTTKGVFYPLRYLSAFTAILNIVFSIWFGRLWGIFGVLIATAVARILTNVWYVPYVMFNKCFKESPWQYFRIFASYLGMILILGAGCYVIAREMHFAIWLNVFFKIILCTVFPNISFWLLFHNTEQYQYLKSKVNFLLNGIKKKTLR